VLLFQEGEGRADGEGSMGLGSDIGAGSRDGETIVAR